MPDDEKTFDVKFRTTADGTGAQKAKADIEAVTAETEKLAVASEQASAAQKTTYQAPARIALVDPEEAENAERAAAAEVKKGIELQKQVLYATQLEALQAAAASDTAGAERLGREAAVLKESLSLQQSRNLSEAQALEQAEATIAAKEKILALDEADDVAMTGRLGRGGRLGTFLSGIGLGEMGLAIGFAVIVGEQFARMIDRSAEAITKETEEQLKFNRELDKQREGFEKIGTMSEWESQTAKIREQIQVLEDRREVIRETASFTGVLTHPFENYDPRAQIDGQINALHAQQRELDQLAEQGIARKQQEKEVQDQLDEQDRAIQRQIASYEGVKDALDAELKKQNEIAKIETDRAVKRIKGEEEAGTISPVEAARKIAEITGTADDAEFKREQDNRKAQIALNNEHLVSLEKLVQQRTKDAAADAESAKQVRALIEERRKWTEQFKAAGEAAQKARAEADDFDEGIRDQQARGLLPAGPWPDGAKEPDRKADAAEKAFRDMEAHRPKGENARALEQTASQIDAATKRDEAGLEKVKKELQQSADGTKDQNKKLQQEIDDQNEIYGHKKVAREEDNQREIAARALEQEKKRLGEQIEANRKAAEAIEEENRKAQEAARGSGRGATDRAGASFDPKLEQLDLENVALREKLAGAGKKLDEVQKSGFESERQKIRDKYEAGSAGAPTGNAVANEISGAIGSDAVMLQEAGRALENLRAQPGNLNFAQQMLPILKEITAHSQAAPQKIKAQLEQGLKDLKSEIEEWMKQVHSP